MDAKTVGKIGDQKNIKRIILTDMYPVGFESEVIAQIQEEYDGVLIIGKDLESFVI